MRITALYEKKLSKIDLFDPLAYPKSRPDFDLEPYVYKPSQSRRFHFTLGKYIYKSINLELYTGLVSVKLLTSPWNRTYGPSRTKVHGLYMVQKRKQTKTDLIFQQLRILY